MTNHSFDIYRKMACLLSEGIHLADILRFMGIKSIYVYGAGKMGEMALSDLSGEMEVLAVFDQSAVRDTTMTIYKRSAESNKENIYEYPLYHPEKIPEDENMILITPASMYSEIVHSLIGYGISKHRFLSLNLLLYYGMYFRTKLRNKKARNVRTSQEKEFLITGAQFSNKGSQAMLFIAMSEIRKRFDKAVIWYCPNFGDKEYEKAVHLVKLIFLLDGQDEDSTLYEVLPRLSGIIDVSGYALASSGSVDATDREMRYFKMAHEYQIPVYLMPQSFGPLDYERGKQKQLRELLSYAKVIFAREQSGYNLLIDTFALTNVKRSYDLVLQNRGVERKYIYTNTGVEKRKFALLTRENVAIIPNTQNYRYGNPKDVLRIYEETINKLLSLGKNIYIISHSEDEYICRDIYRFYESNPKVHLYGEKFDCLEFCELVKNFQYIVASRFHAVVHAYKMKIPCIVIGWAEKYSELLRLFDQNSFLFDVREKIDAQDVLTAIEVMEASFMETSRKIGERLPELQSENCFDVLKENYKF